jgi:hypothetical protein
MFDQLTQGLRELEFLSRLAKATNRRTFLRWSGVSIAVTVAACGDDDEDNGGDVTAPGTVSPGNSTAEVPEKAPPNEPLTIRVQAKDESGNDLTTGGDEVIVEATGANGSGPVTATDNGDGTYEASYLPVNLGTDTIAVTINGEAIAGSPFTVIIEPAVTEVPLGTGDVGLLNYAYALEQLQAAFYTAAVANLYAGASAEETQNLTDIRDHEVIHREFLKALLGTNAIQELQIEFGSVDFASRDSVLAAARDIEDLAVSAYNGAGYLFDEEDNLLAVGKIVSVEARHAAVIRDTISRGTDFAGDDVVNTNGLDVFRQPNQVIPATATYIVTPLDFSELPRT